MPPRPAHACACKPTAVGNQLTPNLSPPLLLPAHRQVEDVKLTEQHIKFSEVSFPPHVSPACRSFIQQALTKRPEGRPSAAQLFQHPWVRAAYQQLAAEQVAQHSAAAAPGSSVMAAAAAAFTPELRRTVSQPPSPSKSMPGERAERAGGEEGAATPAAAASALAPFLPLSQAKMAHKVGGWATTEGGASTAGQLTAGSGWCLLCSQPAAASPLLPAPGGPCSSPRRCGCSPRGSLPAAARRQRGVAESQTPWPA